MRAEGLVHDVFLEYRTELQEALALFLGAEPHDVFDTGPVVPATVKDDDFPGRREVLEISLDVHLRFLAVGGRR